MESARSGNAVSAWILGCAYRDGYFTTNRGAVVRVAKNRRRSMRWLTAAARSGNTGAMLDLAAELSSSRNPGDLAAAIRWEKKAWRGGEEMAAYNLAISFSMAGDAKACFRWLKISQRRCPEDARLLVSVCRLAGYGCEKSRSAAMAGFRKVVTDPGCWPDDRVAAIRFLAAANARSEWTLDVPIGRMVPPPASNPREEAYLEKAAEKPGWKDPATWALAENLSRRGGVGRAAKWFAACKKAGFDAS